MTRRLQILDLLFNKAVEILYVEVQDFEEGVSSNVVKPTRLERSETRQRTAT